MAEPQGRQTRYEIADPHLAAALTALVVVTLAVDEHHLVLTTHARCTVTVRSRRDRIAARRCERLHGPVRFIVAFTITYAVLAAIVAITAGALASSAALIGFGLDSVVEVLSAVAVAWQSTRKDPERWESVTVRAIAIAFFALAAYVSVDAVLGLISQEGPEHSPLGIGITALSLLVTPLLAWYESAPAGSCDPRALWPTQSSCSSVSTCPEPCSWV